ncbi:Hypothetical protein AA314_08855 [Archangium gephyra]|nr:Hypothetical protein AA314_08855 [Archangium gephyra]
MGSRIGAALKKARISLDDLEAKVDLVIDALFSISTLELRTDITREQLESRFGGGVKFQVSMPWKSAGSR